MMVSGESGKTLRFDTSQFWTEVQFATEPSTESAERLSFAKSSMQASRRNVGFDHTHAMMLLVL